MFYGYCFHLALHKYYVLISPITSAIIKEDWYSTYFTVKPTVTFWAQATIYSAEEVVGNACSSIQTVTVCK